MAYTATESYHGSENPIRSFVTRHAAGAGGLAMIALAGAMVLSLVTWHVDDPSLSYSSERAAHNLLGHPGAVFADLAMQGLGLAVVGLVLPLLVVGWNMFRLRLPRQPGFQVLFWLGGTILLAAALACLPRFGNWPLESDLGGATGDLILRLPRSFTRTGELSDGFYAAFFVISAGFALGLLIASCLRARVVPEAATVDPESFYEDEAEIEEEEKGSRFGVLAGLAAHWGLTARSMLKRRIRKLPTPALRAGTSRPALREPGMSRRSGRVADLPANPAAAIREVPAPRRREPVFGAQQGRAEPAFEPEYAEAEYEQPEYEDDFAEDHQPAYAQAHGAEDDDFDDGFDDDRQSGFSGPIGIAAPVQSREQGQSRETAQSREQGPSRPAIQPREPARTPSFTPRLLLRRLAQNAPAKAAAAAAARAEAAASEPEMTDFQMPTRGIVQRAERPMPERRAPERAAPTVEAPAISPKAAARPAPPHVRRPQSAGEFELPPVELLREPGVRRRDPSVDKAALEHNARLLEGVLDDFGVRGEIINVRPGPVVTLYELEPAPGIKSSRVIGLADDIARSMSAIAARVAVVPGRNVIGIELPNAQRETVFLREMIGSEDFETSKARLALTLGKTIGGEPVIADLAKMPHLLVAGTTGSGKSVSINTMILSLIYRLTPQQCRLIMIDPKMLELSIYDGIPHLLTPVVTDPKKAVVALKWTVREMEDRYKKMSKVGVRNIDGYNQRIGQAAKKGEMITRTVQVGFNQHTGEPIFETEELDLEPMPYIVVIIDEMADLMMVAGKEIEGAVQRLAQMARAAGIHVVMATQRPSVDVITGTIKANFPTRISFQVTSKIDSRTILGEQGAEQLLGQGDMLYMAGGGRIQRVHGPFVSDEEVEEIVAHLKSQGMPDYLDAITDEEMDGGNVEAVADTLDESNDLYDKAVAVVLRDRKVSTSYIQRRLSIGYNRAASLIERMEKEGLISPANHAGKREILVGEDSAA
ncbi:DNA segregation ATPase FtsK/SpoIIIE, S-DNA-T family [Faunimonas pinastri]|uniref:DNA translocase FtsK n=1 Tax=Faunimonas pinastri TaxID=1855383 RepID=A0A1H9GUB8_9HYPH|nr:DNA translocase FtsK [Faunimonas pinastri]SEQ53726.1 DNA segregation ATPase FtsK/SpoIIIE, S-DNA-T family [Faunimonas pinastri]